MASYLSQLRKLKLRQGAAAHGAAGPASSKDNSSALRTIASIVAEGTVDEVELKRFFQIFSAEFSWFDATEQEARQCENYLIDLVVSNNGTVTAVLEQLLPQLRGPSGNDAKLQLCGQVFDNVQNLKKKLRQILVESQLDLELEGKDRELVLEVLRNHPIHGGYADEVDAVFTSMHQNPKYRSLRSFFYRRKDGKTADFSYTRCADFVKKRNARYTEAILRVVVELCRLYPRAIGTVAETIESVFPHYNIAIEQHLSVTLALLHLSRHVQALRPVVYRLIFKKMTIIDAEIKRSNTNGISEERIELLRSESLKDVAKKLSEGEIDISEAKALMGNPDWIKQMYENCQTEEDLDAMTQKLDRLMLIMFEELRTVVTENMNKPVNERQQLRSQSITDEDSDSSSESDIDSDQNGSLGGSSTGASEMSDIKQESMSDAASARRGMRTPYGRYTGPGGMRKMKAEKERGAQVVTVADVIISELFDIFEDIILPTLKCKYVQFLYMYVISFRISWTHLFLQRMLLILYDEEAHSMRRKSAASYIASMVCRASFIQGPLVCSTVFYLFSMLGKFDYLLGGYADSTTSSVTSDVTPLSRNRFGESASSKSVTRLGRFYSLLQDILYIVSYHAGTLGESPRCVCYLQECANSVCAFIESQLQPLGRLRQSVVEEAVRATSKVPILIKLHMCLVRAKQNLTADGAKKKSSTLNSVDAWFPFDSFPLYHSGDFIRERYRDGTYYETTQDSSESCVKQEPVDESPKAVDTSSKGDEDFVRPAKIDRNTLQGYACKYVPSVNTIYGDDVHLSSASNKYDKGAQDAPTELEGKQPVEQKLKTETTDSSQGDSMFSVQDFTQRNTDETEQRRSGATQSIGASSSGPVNRSVKARLHEKQRGLKKSNKTDLESDYDFWGVNYGTEGSRTTESDREPGPTGSCKRTKRDESPSDSDNSVFKKLALWGDNVTSRYESSDNSDLIVIGIDQLDDFELSLSSSILVNAPRRGSSSLLDILTSTEAYKSAIVNSEVTKNKHKHSRKAV